MSGSIEYICQMPSPDVQMVDPTTGEPSIVWWNWAQKIFARTGSQPGIPTAGQAAVDATTAATAAAAAQTSANAAQAAANTAQTSANTANVAVATEATARAAGDATNATAITAEATTRAAGDATNATAITAEATARAAADLLLVPLNGARAMTAPLLLPVFTVGTLPAGAAGARAAVSDAAAPVFATPVVGGGAVTVPVYWDGAAWSAG